MSLMCSTREICDFEDFEDDDGYTPEQEKELLSFASSFVGDLKELAKQYIKHFFQDKPFHCGGKIPKMMLINEDNISMVINYDIIRSVNKAYFHLKDHEISSQSLGEVTGDIRLVSSILQELSSANVPRQFAGGLLLMYLELIEGIEFGK